LHFSILIFHFCADEFLVTVPLAPASSQLRTAGPAKITIAIRRQKRARDSLELKEFSE
jgi:hypothetical protein